MRVAVVTAVYGDWFSEEQVFLRRLSGPLAGSAEVSVLVANGAGPAVSYDGAVEIRRFPAARIEADDRRRLWQALFGGPEPAELPLRSSAGAAARAVGSELPESLWRQVVIAEGGHSPELYGHLRHASYDALVFFGYRSASTRFGLDAVGESCPVILVPAARDETLLRFPAYRPVFARADRILVATETERRLVEDWFGCGDRVVNVGFTLRVDRPTAAVEPLGWEDRPTIAVIGDWTRPLPLSRLSRWWRFFSRELADLRIACLGRGSESVPRCDPIAAYAARSRADLWRWMSRAVMAVDLEPHRFLGLEVLESMALEVPVLVLDEGGAAREHAEAGGGGLWHADYYEFCESFRRLREDQGLRSRLGRRGRAYVEETYGNRERFAAGVREAVAF